MLTTVAIKTSCGKIIIISDVLFNYFNYVIFRMQQWNRLNNDLTIAINEAEDNVKFIASLESFYLPLYRNVEDIHKRSSNLLKALRSVYNTSQFFNTSNAAAGFLIKCTNQMTIVCKNYLLEHGSIFELDSKQIGRKITVKPFRLIDAFFQSF